MSSRRDCTTRDHSQCRCVSAVSVHSCKPAVVSAEASSEVQVPGQAAELELQVKSLQATLQRANQLVNSTATGVRPRMFVI